MKALRVLTLPGWLNAGPAHGLSRWQQPQGHTRVAQADGLWPRRGDWMARLDEVLLAPEGQRVPAVLVAHGLGCRWVVAWATHSQHTAQVCAALLVAPPDAERADMPPQRIGWRPFVRQRVARAIAVVLCSGAFCALLQWLGVGLPLMGAAAVVLGLIAGLAPRPGVQRLDRVLLAWRALVWRGEEGRHHSFGGLSLQVEDDGRHVWVAGADLQGVLGTHDREEVLAARVPGRWRRNAEGALMLRVDAVVEHLGHAPGRMEPRTVRLRRYRARELLFPAAERRRRRMQ